MPWHDDVFECILADLSNGHALTALVGGADQPTMGQLQRWVGASIERGAAYEQAKRAYAEWCAFAQLDVARGVHRQFVDDNGQVGMLDSNEAARRDDLLIRTLGWQAERMNPDAYGARINQHRTDTRAQPSRLVIGDSAAAARVTHDDTDTQSTG